MMAPHKLKKGKSVYHSLHTFCYLFGSASVATLYIFAIYSLFSRKKGIQGVVPLASLKSNFIPFTNSHFIKATDYTEKPQHNNLNEYQHVPGSITLELDSDLSKQRQFNQAIEKKKEQIHEVYKVPANLRGAPSVVITLTPSVTISSPSTPKIIISPPLSQHQQQVQHLPQHHSIILLSENHPATSDVRGNLGSVNVVTNEKVDNWLEDRWQAAVDMSGRAIPGEHWVEVDLQRVCKITKIMIDWETAYSKDYTLVGRVYETKHDGNNGEVSLQEYWVILAMSSDKKNVRTLSQSKQHIIHEAKVNQQVTIYNNKGKKSQSKPIEQDSSSLLPLPTIRFVRLIIHSPSTAWGSSVWRLLVYGTEEGV